MRKFVVGMIVALGAITGGAGVATAAPAGALTWQYEGSYDDYSSCVLIGKNGVRLGTWWNYECRLVDQDWPRPDFWILLVDR
ncbi:hypothetical protein [Actinokineospora xionganensis]|uniref:Secreted protein n=1 Tax=Actinokineospora xionganensis TaxID=2684470 RepID=A0ABR7LCA4_9PSEU|nr:hypothetical protein [Actinokineospora xionganensis]MBC6450341.1 hypothetical protein [Actinokineospora xionganensis]